MSVLRISAIGLASLLVIASTMARPAPAGDDAPAATEGAREAAPVADPVPQVPPGAQVHRGGGGVGFSAPHKADQLHAIQQLLGAADDEWKGLSAKVEKVLVAKLSMSTGAGMNWTSSGKAKPVFQPAAAKPDTAPGRAMQGVRAAVDDPNASRDDLTKKMAAVREARKMARADYEAAQNELIETLTPRQQAILMTLGVVE